MSDDVPSPQVLLLPSWQHTAPAPWLGVWQAAHGYRLLAQHDGLRPLRGDWMMQLEEAVLQARPAPTPDVTLVANGLGCLLVAAWAAHSHHRHRVKAALLVAPLDAELDALRARLASWSPLPWQPLPFPSLLLGHQDDPDCSFLRAQAFARAWGSEFMDAGPCVLRSAASGLGDWPQGLALLQRIQVKAQALANNRPDVSKAALTVVANRHPD